MTHRPTRSPAVVETRVIHDTQRRATEMLAAAIDNPSADRAAVAELRDFVVDMLTHHHRREDADLWPWLIALAPDLRDALSLLSREHERLDVALGALATSALTLDDAHIGRLVRDSVREHLAHEEPVLFPALERLITDAAWDAFSRRAVATAPPASTHLLVGLMFEAAPDDDVELVLRHVPPGAASLAPRMQARARETFAALQGKEAKSA